MMGWMEPHLLPAWARYVNDMIHQQCEMFPDRFLGAAMLPQVSDAPDLSNCIGELDRCVRDYGFVAAYVSPDPAGRPADDAGHARAVLVPAVRAGAGAGNPAHRARHEFPGSPVPGRAA